jgi:tRNA1(Val) A37 N6-methylase TrmN6
LAFLLAARGVESWAVEHDAAWVRLARASRLRCDPAVQARVHIVRTDVRAMFLRPARYDLVVTNPPWFDPGEGPVAPDPRKAGARAMLHGRVGDFVTAGLELADRVCVATREERMNELVPAGAHLRRLARLGRRVVLAEVRPGAGVCVEEELDLPAIYAYFRDSPAVPLPLERP